MKYFGLAVAALVMTVSASASQMNSFCTPPGTFTGGAGGPITETCGPFSGTIGNAVGQDTINSVEIFFVSDYQIGTGSSNSVSVTYGVPSAGSFTVAAVDPCVITGASNSVTNTCGFYSTNINAPGTEDESSTLTGAALQSFAALPFTVGVSSAINSGAVQTSAGDVIVEYDYTVNSGVPEPGSMMLLGSGLLAAGLIGRKKLAGRK